LPPRRWGQDLRSDGAGDENNHRLREGLGEPVAAALGTVAHVVDIDAELRHLLAVLNRR